MMRTGRCAQIIQQQQQQRVESHLFDEAVLSIFLMTDSKEDEPEGSAEGEGKEIHVITFLGIGEDEP